MNKFFDFPRKRELPIKDSFKFNSLGPKKDSNIDTYESALNFAISKDGINNVALTGNFGAGKSSILDTYEKKYSFNMMHIELPHYQSQNHTVPNKDKIGLSYIEEKIINQLLSQIKSRKIPLSIFHDKRNSSVICKIGYFLLFATFIVSIFYLNLAKNTNSILYRFKMNPSNMSVYIFMGLLLVTGLIILSLLLLWLSKGWRIHSIKFKSGVVDFDATQETEGSYFDKYMSDVLYLFENAGTNYFVFEDLDRYDIPMIYERLHEINTLLNKRQNKYSKSSVKFFYMLKDDSFVSKDRSKIFDFIIPIIPLMNSDNSYQMVLNTLGESIEEVPNQFLRKLSIYIDDMRLLLNIGNEFQIYRDRLKQEKYFNAGKLLGIITYKNIFPQDFSRLQIGLSFINYLINEKNNLIEERNKIYSQELLEVNSKIEFVNSEKVNDTNELESLYLDFSGVSSINGRNISAFKNSLEVVEEIHKDQSKVIYDGWVRDRIPKQLEELSNNSDFIARKNAIYENRKVSIDKLRQKSAIIKGKIKQVDKLTLGELLFNKDKAYFEEIKKKHNQFETVVNNRYFPLIMFLIREGYIDEHYNDYISYFYPGQLTIGDKAFLRSTFDGIKMPYNTTIKDPDIVLSYLTKGDVARYSIKNVSLTIFTLENINSYNEKFNEIISLIVTNQDTELIKIVLLSLHAQKLNTITLFLNSIYDKWKNFVEICSYSYQDENFYSYLLFVRDVLESLNVKQLEGENWQSISELIENNGSGLFEELEERSIRSVISKLKILECKFNSIDSINNSVLQILCENNMVSVNSSTFEPLLNKAVTKKEDNYSYILSKLLDSKRTWIVKFVYDNLSSIVEQLLNIVDLYNEEEETIVRIINLLDVKTSSELIIEILNKWTGKVSNIAKIKSPDTQDLVLKSNKITVSSGNIVTYLQDHSFKYDSEWTKLINKSSKIISFSSKLESEIQEKIFLVFVGIDGIVKEQLVSILKSLHRCYDKGYMGLNLNKRNVKIMIQNGIILLNHKNLMETKDKDFSNLYLYANNDLEKFISLLDELGLTDSQKDSLIYESGLEDSQRAKIIGWSNRLIDITKLELGHDSFIAALDTGIIESNVPTLLEKILNYDKNLRPKIFIACSKFSKDTIDYLVNNWSKDISEQFIECKGVDIHLRRKLFYSSLNHFSINEYSKWLDILDYPDAFQRVLNRGRQRVIYTSDNYELFEAFRKRNLLTDKSKVDSDTIKMIGKDNFKKNHLH